MNKFQLIIILITKIIMRHKLVSLLLFAIAVLTFVEIAANVFFLVFVTYNTE